VLEEPLLVGVGLFAVVLLGVVEEEVAEVLEHQPFRDDWPLLGGGRHQLVVGPVCLLLVFGELDLLSLVGCVVPAVVLAEPDAVLSHVALRTVQGLPCKSGEFYAKTWEKPRSAPFARAGAGPPDHGHPGVAPG